MPTKHPRHTITETPQLAAVLEPLRAQSDGGRLDFAELVKLGGEAKLRLIEEQERAKADRAAARERFLARTRTGRGIDVDQTARVRDDAWSHE